MKKIPVGVLGATGFVGQHTLRLLLEHPFFEIAFLAASDASSGKSYGEVLQERGHTIDPFPPFLLTLPIHRMDAIQEAQKSCALVFSAIHLEAARVYEVLYAQAGMAVVSNSSAHRLDADVPLVIPEVNPEHLSILSQQKIHRGWDRGCIVAKPNCSLQSYMIPLFPLHRAFRVKKLILTTLQAVSGAGYPGLSSLDILDNLIPYIPEEEEKSEIEPLKILGNIGSLGISPATGMGISAHCNRVSVRDGHTVCVSVEFEIKPTLKEILVLWQTFRGIPQELQLPSAPLQPILYKEEKDRPQPRLDRDTEEGMTVTVGRLRECPVFDVRFVALSHNALRGAAKGSILIAELLYFQGFI